jgi:hypothetical protein
LSGFLCTVVLYAIFTVASHFVSVHVTKAMSSLTAWNRAVSRARAEGFTGAPRKGSEFYRRAMHLLRAGGAEIDDDDDFFTPEKSTLSTDEESGGEGEESDDDVTSTDDESKSEGAVSDDDDDKSGVSADTGFADVLGSMPRALRGEYLKRFGPQFVRTPAKAAELLEALAEDKPVYRRRGPLMFPTVIRRAPRIKVSK